MLRDEVAEAVETGRFHVWAARNVDEGLELLTGRRAGIVGADGTYPEGTVHRRVAERLQHYAQRLHAVDPGPDGAGPSS